MVFILKKGVSQSAVQKFRADWESKGSSTIWARGTDHDAVCLIGNTSAVDMDAAVHTNPIVAYARRAVQSGQPHGA